MKNFLVKLFSILAFIVCFVPSVFALSEFTVSSMIFDNSSSVLLLNSIQNDDYDFKLSPKRVINTDENIVTFDLEKVVLSSIQKDLVTSSPLIESVSLVQVKPNISRLILKYKQGFNPENIKFKMINNSIVVLLSPLHLQNFYFQHTYTDEFASVNKMFEPISIKVPVLAQQNIASQINSAFLHGNSPEKNYVYTQKDLLLSGRYYLDNINIKNSAVIVSGVGSYTITKPFVLANPDRIVYDIPNAQLNPVLRNDEIQINQTDTVKAGQFNENTVRIVVISPECKKYHPVFSYDLQKFIITKDDVVSSSKPAMLSSFSDEIVDKNTHSVKIVFSKPVIYSYERTDDKFDLLLYNVNRLNDENFNSVFRGVTATKMQNNGYKVSFPVKSEDIINIHSGVDGKTMRVRIKSENADLPVPDLKQQEINLEHILPVRPDGKKVVVIDAGHGGSDCGAIRSRINEKDITLEVSNMVVGLLEKKGYHVYMTRYGDETVSLQERVEISENIMPDVFVSIHVNSSNSVNPNGLETHYYKDNSLRLAKVVHASMLNHIKANNRGLFKSKFYVINHTTSPAILVEIGFLSNDNERAQIITNGRKQATAKAIAEGIDEYLKKQ